MQEREIEREREREREREKERKEKEVKCGTTNHEDNEMVEMDERGLLQKRHK
jgi:hypothetical protein